MSDMIPKLREMAESPHYALRRGVLLVAAQHIEQLQGENERLLAAVRLALELADVESIKAVLHPWKKP